VSATELESKLTTLYPLAHQVSDALNGAVYPLDRRELLLVARENDAPGMLLTLMSALRSRSYLSLAEVQESLEERRPAASAPVTGGS